jgi:hypothetical protein
LILYSSHNALVYGNNIADNEGFGIQFGQFCNNAQVYENRIAGNKVGFNIYNYPIKSSSMAFVENVTFGQGNEVYMNNMLGNSRQVFFEKTFVWDRYFIGGGWGQWNPTFVNGTDAVSWDNGTVGNFWSNYNGHGSYVIDENNVDHYPFAQQVDISAFPAEFSWTQTSIIIIVAVILAVAFISIIVYFKKRKH